MRGPESLIPIIAYAMLVLFIGAICSWAWRAFASLFTRAPAPEIPDEEAQRWRDAKQLLSQPRQRVDGSWERARIVWEACDAPMPPNTLEVHDVNAPEHDRKTCRHCNQKPGYSGVSYRSN